MADHPCPNCDKVFTKSYSLKRHMTNVHKVQHKISRRAIQCPYPSCQERFPYIPPMKNHLNLHHGITLIDQQLNFSSMKEFFAWKIVEEERSHVKYIKACGIQRLQDGTEVNRFNCNRTGVYTPEGKGLRRLKKKGTCKMGASCPSTVTANRHPDDTVTVNFCLTHVGHEASQRRSHGDFEAAAAVLRENEQTEQISIPHMFVLPDDVKQVFQHFDVPTGDRLTLAAALQTVPPSDETTLNEALLNETMLNAVYKLADPAMSSACEKLSGELRGILVSPCLQSRDPSAAGWFSVPEDDAEEEEVDEEAREENPIVLYQPENEDADTGADEILSTADDFLLIVMNSMQAHLLRKFGHQGTVYLDSIHGPEDGYYSVLCLFVLDPRGRCFLCALCVCRRIDAEILMVFFDKVRSRAGLVTAKVFMSDGHEYVLRTWVAVMGEAEQWLHSLWWTDATWRQHLLMCLRVDNDRATYATIYYHLCRLLKSDSKLKFCQSRTALLGSMTTARYRSSVSPAKHFEKVLCQQLDNWAWGFRSATLRNLAVQMEATHGAIADLCRSGSGVDGLGAPLFALYQYYRRRSFVYMTDAALRDISRRSCDEQHRRSESLLARGDGVTLSQLDEESVWLVEQEGENAMPRHTVQRSSGGDTCPGKCFARCDDCAACIHEYDCSCVSSTIQWRLCKHIHFVGCHRHDILAEEADAETIIKLEEIYEEEEEEEQQQEQEEEQQQEQEEDAVAVDEQEPEPADVEPTMDDILEEINDASQSICHSAKHVPDIRRLLQLRDALRDVAVLAAALQRPIDGGDADVKEMEMVVVVEEGDDRFVTNDEVASVAEGTTTTLDHDYFLA